MSPVNDEMFSHYRFSEMIEPWLPVENTLFGILVREGPCKGKQFCVVAGISQKGTCWGSSEDRDWRTRHPGIVTSLIT